MDSRKCQTAAVSPAEPGVYPLLIIDLIPQSIPLYGFILDDGTGKLVEMLTAFHAGRAV